MSTSKIARLELHNFKSYHGRVTVGPFLDFTCIVGPNGAGKSNLMDALSFVLGTTAAALRGAKSEDLINRKAKKTESASVSLVLVTPSGHESVLTRTVSPKGDISTSVDSIQVSEKEFGLVLRKHKIGARISNFLVFQHEVEAVAQKKARELTDMLESVSGSGELKPEYNELKRQMDAANEALAAASVDKRGAMAEVAQMRLQKKEAERYEEVNSQLTKQKHELALAELFHLEAKLSRNKAELENATSEAARLDATIGGDDETKRLKRDIAEKHKAYMEALKQNREAGVDLREKRATLERIKAAINHFETRLTKEKREMIESKTSTTVREKETGRLQEQLVHNEKLLEQLEAEWKKEDRALASQSRLTETQMIEYKQLRKEADCQTITLRQESETKRRLRDSLLEGLKQLEQSIDAQDAVRRDIQTAVQRNEGRAKEARDRVAELTRTKEDAQGRMEQVKATLAQLQTKSKLRSDELASVEAQLHELRFVKEDSRQNSRMAEALVTLKSMFPGVRGRLVDLCTIPQPKYRVAVTVALGKNLDAVVVDTSETAIQCVRHLKTQRLACMTFIPLNHIQGTAVEDRLRTFGGTCKPVIDVVKYDSAFEPALRFALGQTLVCDDMHEARRVAYGSGGDQRYKVVTVDGNMLLKNGSIQGGLASMQSRARKWDEKEYDRLKARRAELAHDVAQGGEAEEQRALCEAKDLQSKISFADNRISNAEQDATTFINRNKSLAQDLTKIDVQIRALQDKKAAAQERIVAVETELAALHRQIHDLEKRVFGDFTKRTGVADIADLERKTENLAKTRAEERQKLTLIIHKLKTAIQTETNKVGQRSTKAVEAAVKASEAELKTAQDDLATYTRVVEKATKAQDALQASITKTKTELDALEERIRQHAKATESDSKKLSAARKAVTTLQAACEAVRRQRESLFLQCRMDEVDVPTVSPATAAGMTGGGAAASSSSTADAAARKRGRGADGRGEGSSAVDARAIRVSEAFSPYSAEATSDAAAASSSSSGGMRRTKSAVDPNIPVCIDFSSLSEDVRNAALDDALFAALKQRSEAVIDQRERELEAIAPNLKASTRYTSSEAKLGTTAAQLEEARENARKTTAAFERVKQLRSQRFMATFEKVSEKVDEVYQELTLGTRAHDVHGTAYLALEDPEEPYNGGTRYHATPPMKRFMTMELLSGGERTMAALALLFAIYAVSPAPFFVLDEVDAALDIGNVTKLAQYLRKHSSHCQFIVVSLKEQLYHIADSLIGVFKDHTRESSGTTTLDLRKYPAAVGAPVAAASN